MAGVCKFYIMAISLYSCFFSYWWENHLENCWTFWKMKLLVSERHYLVNPIVAFFPPGCGWLRSLAGTIYNTTSIWLSWIFIKGLTVCFQPSFLGFLQVFLKCRAVSSPLWVFFSFRQGMFSFNHHLLIILPSASDIHELEWISLSQMSQVRFVYCLYFFHCYRHSNCQIHPLILFPLTSFYELLGISSTI